MLDQIFTGVFFAMQARLMLLGPSRNMIRISQLHRPRPCGGRGRHKNRDEQ